MAGPAGTASALQRPRSIAETACLGCDPLLSVSLTRAGAAGWRGARCTRHRRAQVKSQGASLPCGLLPRLDLAAEVLVRGSGQRERQGRARWVRCLAVGVYWARSGCAGLHCHRCVRCVPLDGRGAVFPAGSRCTTQLRPLQSYGLRSARIADTPHCMRAWPPCIIAGERRARRALQAHIAGRLAPTRSPLVNACLHPPPRTCPQGVKDSLDLVLLRFQRSVHAALFPCSFLSRPLS